MVQEKTTLRLKTRLRIRLPVQGDTGLIPAREDSACLRAAEPVRLEPMLHNTRSRCSEKPTHSSKGPEQPKISKYKFKKIKC